MYLTNSILSVEDQQRRAKATNWKMMTTVGYLYWVHTPEMTNPYREGYIGITENIESRSKEHKRNLKKQGIEAEVKVLHQGVLNDLNDLERKYRPSMGTGWNYSQGGNRWSGMGAVEKTVWEQWFNDMINAQQAAA